MNFNVTNICEKKEYKDDSDSLLKRTLEQEKEVFNISKQNLTYDQAVEKCKAYGSKIATKEQLIQAYNKGAHWCDYGWVEGHKAFYPVQKCFENKNCGKPGLNGGF